MSNYIPQTKAELIDHVAAMILSAPTFEDKVGYSPGQNIDSEFRALNDGLQLVKAQLGDGRYAALAEICRQARHAFEINVDEQTQMRTGVALLQNLLQHLEGR